MKKTPIAICTWAFSKANEAAGYIISQLVGAIVAVQWFRMYKTSSKPTSENLF